MRNNETGRSMVEMLGVLAIIGVLSVGGIAGYMMAMNRYHSNNVLEGVSARAVVISAQKMMGQPVAHPADMGANIDDYPVVVAEESRVCPECFGIQVSGIPQGVCRYILNQKWTTPEGVYLNDEEYPTEDGTNCNEKDNAIEFVFSPSMGGESNACGYCQHDDNGTCVADDTCDNGCPGDKPIKGDNGTCYSCGGWGVYATTETECAKCPNRSMRNGKCVRDRCPDGQWMASTLACFDCGEDSAIPASETECAKCSNRYLTSEGCALKECPDGTFRDSTDSCVECSYEYGREADATECAKCPNRDMQEGQCMLNCPNGQFRQYEKQSNFCHNCGYYWATTVLSAIECAKCPEREMYNGKCVLKECPSGTTRRDDGSCA